MAQAARRRRTQPSLTPPPSEPPEPPELGADLVTCFLSGARLNKSEAVLVRLGPGKVMWMAKELTSQR